MCINISVYIYSRVIPVHLLAAGLKLRMTELGMRWQWGSCSSS